MKVTTIRLRKLVSTPHGYGHHAVELEAQVEPGETYDEAVEKLGHEVDVQIRQAGERDQLRQTLDQLRSDVKWHEDRLVAVKMDVATNRAIIKACDKLQDLAAKHGIPWNDKGNPLSF